MLDQILATTQSETLTFNGTIAIVISALVLGLCISLVYRFTHRGQPYSDSFTVTLIMLPTIIAMIILLVGSNVARAFSLAGAFSLIRFRSAPGDSKDIAYVFFTLAVGLACGMGAIGYAGLFTAVLCGVMLILRSLRFGHSEAAAMQLKIVLPENMDYQDAFDTVLQEYTSSYRLVRVKTADFGSLFELTFDVTLKGNASSKALIDQLRARNGNLNVVLALKDIQQPATL